MKMRGVLSFALMLQPLFVATTASPSSLTEKSAQPPQVSDAIPLKELVSQINSMETNMNFCKQSLADLPDFSCPDFKKIMEYFVIREEGELVLFGIINLKQKGQMLQLRIIPETDPEILEKMTRSFSLAMVLKSRQFAKVWAVKSRSDHLVVVQEGQLHLFMETPLFIKSKDKKAHFQYNKEGWQILDALRLLHKQKQIAVRFEIDKSGIFQNENLRMSDFRCLTPENEEVGKCQFNLLVDPRVRKNPKQKPDVAMDYYTLGCYLYLGIKKDKNPKLFFKNFESSLENNKIEFDADMEPVLALLISLLLQNDFKRRVQDDVIDRIRKMHQGRFPPLYLGKKLVIDLAQDPTQVDEFQADLRLMSLSGKRTDIDPPDQLVVGPVEMDHNMFWPVFIGGGMVVFLLLITVLVCCCGKREEEKKDETKQDATKELNVTEEAD